MNELIDVILGPPPGWQLWAAMVAASLCWAVAAGGVTYMYLAYRQRTSK
jgi:hypothetical protein